jgi:putative transposase
MVETIWGLAPPARNRGRRALRGERGRQRSLAETRTWGGRREGAGRKAASRPRVVHEARPEHVSWCPVHVTLRRAKGLPSLRSELLLGAIRDVIATTRRRAADAFRIVEYSVQADHVHLIVEAQDKRALSSGMRSFAIRAALRVKGALRRERGRVWGDRYHRHDLASPREVRWALVYVINNHMKHGESDAGLVDPCSSGPWFTGWMHVREPARDPPPVARADSWLLREGWHRRGGGYIHIGERPKAARAARVRI